MLMDFHLVAGTGAGVLTALLLHPMDLIKVRFQVADGASPSRAAYPSILAAARDVLAKEGARGFYKGVVPACWGSGVSWGLYFYFYEAARNRLAPGGKGLSTRQTMYAAWEGGTITVLFTNPLWLIKTRMQLARPGGAVGYASLLDAFRTITRDEGLRGLYRGVIPALLLTSHGAVQFGVYEHLKRSNGLALGPMTGLGPTPLLFVYGAISKAAAVTVTYPYQVVKARLQQRGEGPNPSRPPYGSMRECVAALWAREGARGFYKGFAANMLRVAPQSAVTLSAYEAIRGALEEPKAQVQA
jgi:solute carrier family 25 folate transporter 32